jgi:tetratricopeptide (TPR) repeat protein
MADSPPNKEISALLADMGHAPSWLSLGLALRKLKHFESALACVKRALDLEPQSHLYQVNYAACLFDMDKKDESLEAYEKAAKSKPEDFHTHMSYAVVATELGAFEKAVLHSNKALTLKPGDAYLQWNLARAHLQAGQFQEGWKLFESRLNLPGMAEMKCSAPRWKGENLAGKTLLLVEEQGFGDTILCSRYIPLLKKRGARIIFKCKKDLHRLFQTLPGVDVLTDSGKIAERADYFVSLMSLPALFETGMESIPPAPDLNVPEIPAGAKRLLDLAKDRFKVGIVWSGSPKYKLNFKRATTVERFLALAEVPGVQLYSLQKEPFNRALAECGGQGPVLELGAYLQDFADTAAVLQELDLVIMTDSAVAHLAGSLNRPVWNLLSYSTYWLYLREREDCPWYPSMRLFRQPQPGDWDSVFRQAAVELEKAAARKRA